MAISTTPYGVLLSGLGGAAYDFANASIRMGLLASSYTPNLGTHTFYSDVNAHQVGSVVTLANTVWAYSAGFNQALLSADSAVFTAVPGTFRYGVVFRFATAYSSSRLIGLINFGEDKDPQGQDVTLNFTNGVLRLAPAA